jgi:hypothetical protein
MQQRQLRLGDILDDYCPRERRLTNHAVVAMVGDTVKQTRCTTCDTEHEYKHAKVPRQRKKSDSPAVLYAQVLANGPKKVAHDSHDDDAPSEEAGTSPAPMLHEDHDEQDAIASPPAPAPIAPIHSSAPAAALSADAVDEDDEDDERTDDVPQGVEEGPVHRRLIRAQLPRIEGQPPAPRPAPDFTIRQPAGRPARFRPRGPRPAPGGGAPFQGNRGNGNFAGGGPMRGGAPRQNGRPPAVARGPKRHGGQAPGRKRSK